MKDLANHYRPDKLESVIGQPHVATSLQSVIKTGMQKCFMFSGPSGVGKTTFAKIVAKLLKCPHPLEFDAATHSGVDNIRAITEGLDFKPAIGKNTVVIVDECQMLSKAAWNSLLIPLEKPDNGVFWVFCTTEPTKVPKTVQTRCAKYNLRAVPTVTIRNLLMNIRKEEKMTMSKEIVDYCALVANGSVREAINNLAMCVNAKDMDAAKSLVGTQMDSVQGFKLVQALNRKTTWPSMAILLKTLPNEECYATRMIAIKYGQTMLLGAQDPGACVLAGAAMRPFMHPGVDYSDKSVLVYAFYRAFLALRKLG